MHALIFIGNSGGMFCEISRNFHERGQGIWLFEGISQHFDGISVFVNILEFAMKFSGIFMDVLVIFNILKIFVGRSEKKCALNVFFVCLFHMNLGNLFDFWGYLFRNFQAIS